MRFFAHFLLVGVLVDGGVFTDASSKGDQSDHNNRNGGIGSGGDLEGQSDDAQETRSVVQRGEDDGVTTVNLDASSSGVAKNALKFETVMKMIDFDSKTVKPEKIAEYLKKTPSSIFPRPETGNVIHHFFETDIMQSLATLYSAAKTREKSTSSGSSAASSKPPTTDLDKAVISAVDKLKEQIVKIVSQLSDKESPNILRNIEYLIGALWFLDHRRQFFSPLVPKESENIQSLKLFEQMLDLVLEDGFLANVGMNYTVFAEKCFTDFDVNVVPESEAPKEGRFERMSNWLKGAFSKASADSDAGRKKVKVTVEGLVPALMAYEAVAESSSARVLSETVSNYSKFRNAVDNAKKAIKVTCSDPHKTALEKFTHTVLAKSPSALLTFDENAFTQSLSSVAAVS